MGYPYPNCCLCVFSPFLFFVFFFFGGGGAITASRKRRGPGNPTLENYPYESIRLQHNIEPCVCIYIYIYLFIYLFTHIYMHMLI